MAKCIDCKETGVGLYVKVVSVKQADEKGGYAETQRDLCLTCLVQRLQEVIQEDVKENK